MGQCETVRHLSKSNLVQILHIQYTCIYANCGLSSKCSCPNLSAFQSWTWVLGRHSESFSSISVSLSSQPGHGYCWFPLPEMFWYWLCWCSTWISAARDVVVELIVCMTPSGEFQVVLHEILWGKRVLTVSVCACVRIPEAVSSFTSVCRFKVFRCSFLLFTGIRSDLVVPIFLYNEEVFLSWAVI